MMIQSCLNLGGVVPAVEKQMAWCLGKYRRFKRAVEGYCSEMTLGHLCRVLSPPSSSGDL